MKRFITAFGLMAGVLTLTTTACNNDNSTSSTTTDSTAMATENTAAPADTTAAAPAATETPEAKFVNFVVPANANEMAWLMAGMSKGNAEIKSHAKMMLADHKKMGKDVADYAAKHNMTLPMADTTNAVTINDKTGKDWDKAWVDKMVDDHQNLLDKLNSSQNEVTDPDLKTIITGAIPVVQSHLDMAKKMQDKMNK